MGDKKTLLKKYNRLENNNCHNDCAILLAKNFGTQDEVDTLEKIKSEHLKRGNILYEEIEIRNKINRKYYKLLH